MLTVISMTDKLSTNIAISALSGLVVLPLAWRLLFGTDNGNLSKRGTRNVVRPLTTKPLLGDTLDVMKNVTNRHDWITSLCLMAKGDPVLLQSWGTPDMLLLSTPEAFEDVLKNQFDNFPKGPKKTEYLADLLGEGIFAVDHEKWYHQRKTASNLFSMRALRDSMSSTIQRHLVVLNRMFRHAAETNETLDMFSLLNRFTLEAFTEIGFGVQINCLDTEREHPFQTAFDRVQQSLALRFIRPSWFWRFQRFFGIGNEGQVKKDMHVINSMLFDIIKKNLDGRAKKALSDEKGDKNIISLFLDGIDSSSNGVDSVLDPTYIRDVIVNFLIAGRDTTAQALSWFFICLSKHPHVEAKIREELAAKLPNLLKGQCSPTMDEVSELTYLEAALRETLRLYPSVPMISKDAVHDTVLSDGTFITAKTMVTLPMYALGRMPHVWGPDAVEFKPERWIESGKLISVSAFKFVAFNAGPRQCLGKNLAMLEMKLIIASLLSKYHVELESPETVTYAVSVTLPVKGQLNAKIVAI
ncbi:hypothetical protein CCR75_002157 [Bremia lactucae]|uniref:Cytochrome P450 n=1 Tax=Bremia lactucae TaxID=4779 RepID=A0A976ICM0_BRELC|nr:hypothetical protein CCR75_002157 [Bremia lactucae]